MKRLVLLLLPLFSCGPDARPDDTFSVQFAVAGAIPDVARFQVAALRQRETVDCLAITGQTSVGKKCLKDQGFATSRFVTFKNAQGRDVRSVSFPISLTSQAQTITLTLPANTDDYAIVVEAETKDDLPKLAGSGCAFVTNRISTGSNAGVNVPLTIWKMPVSCDPRFE